MFLEITIIILSLVIVFLIYFLTQQKSQDKEQISNLASELKQSATEIQALKDLLLTNFATNQASTKERFDYLDKSFNELNKVFASSKRGMLGNSYLNELLAIILPQDKQVYQLE
jgi:predicted DNA binding CopG/RHH family protein